MSKWHQVSRVSGAQAIERKTRHCVLMVVPRNWANKNGPASWITRCSDNPLRVDAARGPHSEDPGYVDDRGYTEKLSTAKTSAMRSAERVERSKRKLHPDHAHIESIARDAEKQAKAVAKSDPTAAARLRTEARRIREEKFAGRRRRKTRRA